MSSISLSIILILVSFWKIAFLVVHDLADDFCVLTRVMWLQSPFEGIQAANGAPSLTVVNDQPPITGTPSKTAIANATSIAQAADAVIFVIGGDWSVEHEGMDRSSIDLPGSQAEVVQSIAAALRPGVPVIAVLIHGGRSPESCILSHPSLALSTNY